MADSLQASVGAARVAQLVAGAFSLLGDASRLADSDVIEQAQRVVHDALAELVEALPADEREPVFAAMRDPFAMAPPDSPIGLVRRAWSASTFTDPAAAVDRLVAAVSLGGEVAEQEHQAVIGVRMARVSWLDIARALGWPRSRARARWRPLVARLEEDRLLFPDELPAPVPPVDATAGQPGDARSWCRWCGNRVAIASGGFYHCGVDEHGTPTVDPVEVDCNGPEPWPAWDD